MESKTAFIMFIVVFAVIVLAIAIAVPLSTMTEGSLSSKEKARKWMQESPLIDGHNDLPWELSTLDSLTDVDLRQRFPWGTRNGTTDIPRLKEGLVGAQFWSCWSNCSSQYKDATTHLLRVIDIVKRMCRMYPETFEFVTTSQGIRDAFENGKIASLIGIEGAHAIQSDLSTLRMVYELGARYMTITHNCDTPWATSWLSNNPNVTSTIDGLTPFGEKIIREMNRLGMLVDIAHVSTTTALDILNIPNTPPVMVSHTGAFEVCKHYRNIADEVLQKIKENGGVVMLGFYTDYLKCPPYDKGGVNISVVADHIEHVRSVCGIQCVGIGSDFWGSSETPIGLEDVSKFPNLIAELIDREWGESDIKALIGGNLLRVFEAVEEFAAKSNGVQPQEARIPSDEYEDNQCRTFLTPF